MTRNLGSKFLSVIYLNTDVLLCMHSESLNFMFKNSFGFDTLTVNGSFEEVTKNGFVRATKTLAIENLNNLGIKIEGLGVTGPASVGPLPVCLDEILERIDP